MVCDTGTATEVSEAEPPRAGGIEDRAKRDGDALRELPRPVLAVRLHQCGLLGGHVRRERGPRREEAEEERVTLREIRGGVHPSLPTGDAPAAGIAPGRLGASGLPAVREPALARLVLVAASGGAAARRSDPDARGPGICSPAHLSTLQRRDIATVLADVRRWSLSARTAAGCTSSPPSQRKRWASSRSRR